MKNRHLENLAEHIPNLAKKHILDIGSGRGDFVVAAAKLGGRVVGLERNKQYIKETLAKAKKNKVEVKIINALAEKLPFKTETFDLINISEVLEHVNDPLSVLKEVYRVLKKGGTVYLSICNRYGLKDPHYKLYFINWLPRRIADLLCHKQENDNGRQRLSEMHYYTYRKIKAIFDMIGYAVVDIREKKIKHKIKNKILQRILLLGYVFLRSCYFSTMHLLIRKG